MKDKCALTNYTVVDRWTAGGYHWFTVAWPGGRRSTHCVRIGG